MSRCHTFLFADLVGFTAFTERHGDEAAADVAVRFAEAAARLAHDHGVRVVKCLGDGMMLRGHDAARVVRLGVLMQSELAGLDGIPPIHAGAHTGCAIERAGDWFGAAVNLAARVSDAARGGELLVTEATVAAAGNLRGIELESLGPQLFRNIGQATGIYSARPLAQRREAHALEIPWARRSAVQPAAA
jgi:adenylate cyclase